MAADKCVVNNVSRYVVGLAHVGLADRAEVGGKNASIGELLKLEFRAPRGFAVTASAYQLFLEVNQLRERIAAILSELDTSRGDQLETASAKIRSAFEAGRFPPAVEEAIRGSYKTLAREVDDPEPSVAVRSSATSEDSAEASFAGQQDTYLHVRGEEQVLAFIKKCYGSVFTPRAIAYREERGFEHLAVQLSVGIMEMVNSKSSGVCFTLDPVSGKREVLVVEGSWGLGETVVQGKVMPDRFVLDKENLRMLERKISEKRLMMIRGKAEDADAHTIEIPVPDAMVHAPCVSEAQLHELAKVALRIEAHYGKPVDIEWAVDEDSNALYVVQARPETVWSLKKDASKRQTLIKGLGASPGKAHGAVHVIDDVRATEDFHEGEVLVTKMTTPDWVPAMRRAAAIVTDSGGMTAHAAIVSRELGLPCVVGTGKATEVLQNGQTVTVDGTLGVVLSGVHDDAKDGRGENGVRASGDVFIPTATRVYMNLGEPSVINEWRHLPFDGIGLMRVEFILASWVGQHPLDMLKRGQEDLFVEKLAEGITLRPTSTGRSKEASSTSRRSPTPCWMARRIPIREQGVRTGVPLRVSGAEARARRHGPEERLGDATVCPHHLGGSGHAAAHGTGRLAAQPRLQGIHHGRGAQRGVVGGRVCQVVRRFQHWQQRFDATAAGRRPRFVDAGVFGLLRRARPGGEKGHADSDRGGP
eukprot:ctg_609.g279